MFHDKEFIIVGNQKWQGAKANFIIKLIANNDQLIFDLNSKDAVSKIPEARAWIIKYLIAASFSWLLLDWRRSGINEYMLSSSPIQIENQLLDVREIKIPRSNVKWNINEYGFSTNKFIEVEGN